MIMIDTRNIQEVNVSSVGLAVVQSCPPPPSQQLHQSIIQDEDECAAVVSTIMVEEVIVEEASSPPPSPPQMLTNDAALPMPSFTPPPPFSTEAESATQKSVVLHQEEYQQPTNNLDDKSAPVETGGELVLSKTQPLQPQQQQPSQPLPEEQPSQPLLPEEKQPSLPVDIGVDDVVSVVQQSSTLHHQQQQHDMDLDDANDASAASQTQQDAEQVLCDDASSVEELLQQHPIGNAVQVTMCKSNLLLFNFETSLVRDETKLASIIIKSLPEYVDSSDIELEYQGESIEGIFSGADKHHVCGQPIDDINKNRLMRGLVYYVRELISSEDEEERATAIILCWTDDAASTSEIFLERVSICEYLRLMEDGYVLCYV